MHRDRQICTGIPPLHRCCCYLDQNPAAHLRFKLRQIRCFQEVSIPLKDLKSLGGIQFPLIPVMQSLVDHPLLLWPQILLHRWFQSVHLLCLFILLSHFVKLHHYLVH